MSRFGELMGGAPAPEPVIEDVVVSPKEEVLIEATPLAQMTKDELEDYGRTVGIELDRRHSRRKLIKELQEHLDTL